MYSGKFIRRILFGFGLMWGSVSTAQVSLIAEDFNAFPTSNPALPNQGWVNRVIAGSTTVDQWLFSNPGARTFSSPISGRFAIFDSDDYSAAGGAENVALESPSFSAQNFATVRLKFDQYFDGIFNQTDSILVEVYNGVKWLSVYSYTGSASISNSQDLNITSNLGGTSNAQVRFRFVGDWSYYWIIDNVKVEGYYAIDAAVNQVSFASGVCGDVNDSVSVSISNAGIQNISNFLVKANIQGSLNGNSVNSTMSRTYSGSLVSGASTSIKLPPFNTAQGGTLVLSAWTELGTDQNRSNDSTKKPQLKFLGTPNSPTVTNASRCGGGMVNLQAGNVSSSDSVVWYNSSSSAAPVGSGLSYTPPFLSPGNYTYYVSAGRGALDNFLQTTFAAGNGQSGVMFNVGAKRTVIVDSFEVSIDAGTHLVEVYYKTGTYVGFETNAGAWTLLGSTTVTSTQANGGSGLFVNVGQSLTLPAGSNYAFYIQLPNSTAMNYTNGAMNFSNAELQIQTGVGKGANFGATFSPRSFNGGIYYSYFPLCESPRTPLLVEIKPLPSGSSIIEGTPFVGTYNTGNMIDPHVVADGDSVSFEIVPPTGTSNSSFGSDWTISNVSMETVNGTPVPSTDTTTFAPGASNGSLLFVPSLGVSDSTFKIVATVTSLVTGCDTLIEAYVYVAPRPNATFTYNATCDGDAMQFVNNSAVISGLLSFDWDFAGLGTSQLENPSFVFPAAGTYSVVLKTTSDYGYTDYDTQTVVVKEVPQTTFDAVNACEGSAVQLTNTTIMPAGTPSFFWDFGDGNTDNAQNTSHVYATPGTYTVTYTVDVNGCSSTFSKTVTQAPRAVVNFSSVSSCNNTEVAFTNSSTLLFGTMGYQWDFGDSKMSTNANPMHDYAGFGTFDVTLRAYTDLGCVDSFTTQVTLTEAPEISIAYSAPCAGESISFTNNSVVPAGFVNSYDWSFGDGATSTVSDPTHTYPGVGSYSLFVRSFSTNGCTDTMTMNIVVNEKPQAGIVAPSVVCDGEEVDFKNSTVSSQPSKVGYMWDLGNGQSSMSKDTSIVYGAAGSYDVMLIATITGGCADTAMKTIKVSPVPSAGFTVTSALTRDGTIQFIADETAAGTKYQWKFDDGFKSTLQDPIHQYIFDGTYYVELVTTNTSNCSSKRIERVRIFRTGFKDAEFLDKLSVYPNPNNGRFSVELEGATFENLTVNVVNALGQEIPYSHQMVASHLLEVDLLDAQRGVYFITFTDSRGSQLTLRIIYD